MKKIIEDLTNMFPDPSAVGSGVRYTSSSGIPLPTKLQRLEFHSSLGGWNVSSSIYKTKETDDSAMFSSAFRLVRRGEDLVWVNASYMVRGQLAAGAAGAIIITGNVLWSTAMITHNYSGLVILTNI